MFSKGENGTVRGGWGFGSPGVRNRWRIPVSRSRFPEPMDPRFPATVSNG